MLSVTYIDLLKQSMLPVKKNHKNKPLKTILMYIEEDRRHGTDETSKHTLRGDNKIMF